MLVSTFATIMALPNNYYIVINYIAIFQLLYTVICKAATALTKLVNSQQNRKLCCYKKQRLCCFYVL